MVGKQIRANLTYRGVKNIFTCSVHDKVRIASSGCNYDAYLCTIKNESGDNAVVIRPEQILGIL